MKQQLRFIIRHLKNYLARSKKKREFIRLCKQLPLDDHLLLFESFQGRGFSDSPKAIYLRMLSDPEYDNYRFVISLREPQKAEDEGLLNERTTLVEAKSDLYYHLLAQAKYVISNSIFDLAFKKRAGQFYIQTWHGTPLKHIGWDIKTKGNNVLNRPYQIREMYRQDAVRYDLVTSPSYYFTEKFSSAFALKKWGKTGTIVQTGYPKNDLLLSHTPDDIERIRQKYNIANDKTVILYAPTWREDKHTLTRGYEFDLHLDPTRLREQFGNDYVFIFKMHQFVSDYLNIDSTDDDRQTTQATILDLSHTSDIRELFLISDALITDYSSVLFDYALLERPILYYLYDLEKYETQTRGLYLDPHYLPGPILHNEAECVQALKDLNTIKTTYAAIMREFNWIYNYLEDGNSAKRTIEALLRL